MSWRISASVRRWERGARNNRRDVETVQTLLAGAALLQDDALLDPGGIDGSIARSPATSPTVRAIERFQSVSGLIVDGVIEANRRTWNELVRITDSANAGENPNPPGQTYFPFGALPGVDWTSGMRAFGANRSSGRLVGISVPSDMLHIEVYDKTATGDLTVRDTTASAKRADNVAFGRRRDLVDPTQLLAHWSAQLPA